MERRVAPLPVHPDNIDPMHVRRRAGEKTINVIRIPGVAMLADPGFDIEICGGRHRFSLACGLFRIQPISRV